MSSLVLDLQQEVLNKDCDILNALRKAHLIASKLQLKEFDIWIQHELNGYENCSRDEIPNYRTVKGALKAFNPYNGWIPAQCTNDEMEQLICEQKCINHLANYRNYIIEAQMVVLHINLTQD